MRVLLTGGGTAGHINPAIALADIIKERWPSAAIAFVGTPNGMEKRLIHEAGYPMYPIRVEGFHRSLSPKNIRAAWLAMTSPHLANNILNSFQPDLVIGTGGYVSWPLLRAAASAGIPTALHESNAVPGLTTRRLAPYMDALWLNFRETGAALPPRCVSPVHTGNPLRRGFTSISKEEARRELGLDKHTFFILSFGGSRGAENLNAAILQFMKEELPKYPDLTHIHACGEAHIDACQKVLGKDASPRAILLPYISKMATYMSAADLVISRAGAMTISELAACHQCAILIPSPYVAQDHQRKNAALLSQSSAAIVIEESDLPKNKLGKEIFRLIKMPVLRNMMKQGIAQFAPKKNTEIFCKQIELLAKKRAADANC